jgi:hypothetical protein
MCHFARFLFQKCHICHFFSACGLSGPQCLPSPLFIEEKNGSTQCMLYRFHPCSVFAKGQRISLASK